MVYPFSLSPSVVLITCSVFQKEVLSLCETCYPGCETQFLSSMLHINPQKLENQLVRRVKDALVRGCCTLLVYGDCCAGMADLERMPGVARVDGHNCCELVLGRAAYHKLEHEGVFFLLPEWARRWREIFTAELGLTRENAVSLMTDMHSRLVYLDFGLEPVPEVDLLACAEYVGLPFETMPVKLDVLKAKIDEAVGLLEMMGPAR